jgi:hypothetical protein
MTSAPQGCMPHWRLGDASKEFWLSSSLVCTIRPQSLQTASISPDFYKSPLPVALTRPMVDDFHCVWINERLQNAVCRPRADHILVRGPSVVQKLSRSGCGFLSVRLFEEGFGIGSRSRQPVRRCDTSGVIAHRTIPTDCGGRK